MKKIKVIVKHRIATWMKDTTETFTMTDKVYDNSVNSVALIGINGRRIECMGIYRDTTAESHIRCNSVATTAQYIANAMAKHYQDITIRKENK